MHLRRTNTAMFPVLEHDRSASSTVVQSTTMSTVFRHRRAHAMPRAHVRPRCRAWCSAAPSQPSFIACAPSWPKCSESAASVASCSSRRRSCCRFAVAASRGIRADQLPCRRSLEEIAPARDPRCGRRVPVERHPAKKCARQGSARSKGGGANRAVCDSVATARSDRRQRQSDIPERPVARAGGSWRATGPQCAGARRGYAPEDD